MKKIFILFAVAAVTLSSLAVNVKEVQRKKELTLKSEVTVKKQAKKAAKLASSLVKSSDGGATTSTRADDDSDWTNIGEATFMDGWVLPAFNIDQTDEKNWYKVPLQQNNTNQNRYRLVDPYHHGPLASYNESTTKGYIVFDVTDPNAVFFEKAVAGFAFKQAGITTFYCYNVLGMYYQILKDTYDLSPAEITKQFAGKIPFTTFQDGVVTLGSAMTEDGLLYDVTFGDQASPSGGYTWTDENDNLVNMNAAIFFPKPDHSEVIGILDNDNIEVEYFNLQGVRVANPEAGQLVIKRQGNKSEKIIF